mgnify:CR=1 FL=1
MRSVRLDADLGTGFVFCTVVQELGVTLRLVLDADLGTGFDGHKKGRHTRCLPVDQKVWLMSSFIELPADHTHQIDVPIIDPDSRTPA